MAPGEGVPPGVCHPHIIAPVCEDESEAFLRLVHNPAGAAQADAMHEKHGGTSGEDIFRGWEL